MPVPITHDDHPHPSIRPRNATWQVIWPAALAVLVAGATAYGLSDGRNAASVVAASGLVYLAASATGRRQMAWIGFAVTFPLIGLAKFVGFDAVPWILGMAGVLLAVGVIERRARPWWSFPLQAVAMLTLGVIAFAAMRVDPMPGGLLVATALIGHAAWDIHHHRADRVVYRSLAKFCAVLDLLVATLVVVVTFRS